MRKALISDIHGNLEALEAVLKDIESQNVDEVYCLGDIVGYGPDPEACIDLVEHTCALKLMGNHDFALLTAAYGFNPIARSAIDYIRERLKPDIYSLPRKKHRWEFIGNLEERRREGEFLFVHASPRDPISEYLIPGDAELKPEKLATLFSMMPRCAFGGHTHLPGVFTEEPAFYTPAAVDHTWTFEEGKNFIINIGSVGQPRDRDSRACYLLLEDFDCRWRRVEYDFTKTIRKVEQIDHLDDRCGLRLAEGR